MSVIRGAAVLTYRGAGPFPKRRRLGLSIEKLTPDANHSKAIETFPVVLLQVVLQLQDVGPAP